MRILVAIEAVDGRKGIDSLARLCQEKLQEDPFSGCLFVFRSRRGTSIRILTTTDVTCRIMWSWRENLFIYRHFEPTTLHISRSLQHYQ